ncbi:hypothetical protein ACIG3E_21145 [Streptomyces sp. NPDC053474]|uniref:hypothetical protein n=1 Tax=Streptomyces sp. NPDC053474 TaxID=3365704 RepID=UPI0037CCCF74
MAQSWRPGVRATGTGTLPPLPALPEFPGMRGYTALRAALRDLGFQHAAGLLREPARRRAAAGVFGTLPQAETDDGFRVLDGLWFPGRGGLWQRVDVPYVRQAQDAWRTSADPRALTAAAVVDTLETLARDDPMGLRRVVLWELCCLLKDRAPGPEGAATTADDVAALGVHRSEARLLAAAVDAGFPAEGPLRRAAETVNDVWPGRRLRAAERVADALPRAPQDHVLARLLGSLRARSAAVARLAARADALEERGDWRGAATAWLGALREAEDAPETRTGLLRAATGLADATAAPGRAPTTVAVDDLRVRLTWRPPRVSTTVTYQVLRFPDGEPERATELTVPPSGLTAEDARAPLGRALRYAVVPLRGGRVIGVPLVTAPVLIAPDASDLTAVLVPDGVRLHWRPHPAATAVRVRRSADGAPPTVVASGPDRLLDVSLPVGTYAYEVSCGYPGGGPGGGTAWSPGARVTVRVEEWPAPVTELTAHRAGDRVRLAWSAPERGEGTLVAWPAGPVAPGADVSARYVELGAAPAPARKLEVTAPPGRRLRLTAVSTLGERAVAGPSVVVEHPCPIRDVTVRRIGAGRAEVRFTWPEPAVLARVAWDDGARREERSVARSTHLAAGGKVTLAVPETACTVTVAPLPRPDAVAVPAAPARVTLPAAPPPLPPGPPARRPWWHRFLRRGTTPAP